MIDEPLDENEIYQIRKQKLADLRQTVLDKLQSNRQSHAFQVGSIFFVVGLPLIPRQ